MWRSYYEQRYAALLVDLYALNRDEYGFSPADSLAIGFGNLGQREHDVLSCPQCWAMHVRNHHSIHQLRPSIEVCAIVGVRDPEETVVV